MQARIAIGSGVASFSIGVVLGISEIQGWKMPTPLALALISLAGLLALIAAIIVIHGIWVVSARYRRGWRLQAPFYNVGRQSQASFGSSSHPPKMYPAMLRADRENPSRLLIVRPRGINWSHSNLRVGAYIDFNVNIFSASAYRLEFGDEPTGKYARYLEDGEEIGEITASRTIANLDDILKGLERSHEGTITLRQYLTPEIKQALEARCGQKAEFNLVGVTIPAKTYSITEEGSLAPGPTWQVNLPTWRDVIIPNTVLSPDSDRTNSL